MKNMKYLLLNCFLLLAMAAGAQELTVKRMEVAVGDLTASVQPRNDLNGNACALVKVQLATPGARFEGNVIGDVEFKTGEYWVYMSEGSYMLNIKHPSFLPLFVNFRDYDIKKVEGKTTYVLTLVMPQGISVEKKQKLIINFTPSSATVLVDAKLQRGNGHVELELPVGEHSYVIAADGYSSVEGTVKLNAESPRTITESLVKLQSFSEPTEVEVPTPQVNTSQQPVVANASATTPQAVTSTAPSIETFTVNGVSFNMVRVEGGTFQMGSNDSDASSNEQPVHQVTLSTYSIGETEVTQALWEAVMGSNPSKWKGGSLPVEQVSWNDCQTFIQKLNQLTGKQFRLPTEAEWEYAARGGSKSRGYKYSGSNTIDDVAWYWDNSGKKTHPVKAKQANELGLYDMTGNVLEWCQDWYGKYSSSPQTNPKGPSSASGRVYRGGGWYYGARFCRVSERGGLTPGNRYGSLGLRLAL